MTKPSFRVAPQMHAIDIPEGMSASYANMVRIAHMPTEFVLDFALKLPGTAPAEVTSRVLISPLSAKLFLRALAENLSRYEKIFGEINIPGEANLKEYSKLFSPPPPPDQESGQAGSEESD